MVGGKKKVMKNYIVHSFSLYRFVLFFFVLFLNFVCYYCSFTVYFLWAFSFISFDLFLLLFYFIFWSGKMNKWRDIKIGRVIGSGGSETVEREGGE